jgi:hypothetical protein
VTLADEATGQARWAEIKVLTDDNLEGRLTGSEAYICDARYVTSQFDAARLKSAVTDGGYQPVKFDVTRVLPQQSSMILTANGEIQPPSRP